MSNQIAGAFPSLGIRRPVNWVFPSTKQTTRKVMDAIRAAACSSLRGEGLAGFSVTVAIKIILAFTMDKQFHLQ
jgi:hypothetical protein